MTLRNIVDARHQKNCLLVTLLVAGTSACGATGSDAPKGPYSADIQQAKAKTTSDFQRQVLADGKITRAEYEEAVDRYVSCMNSHGAEISKTLNSAGYYYYSQPGVASPSSWTTKCADDSTGFVESLYVQMLRNPNHIDENELMAQCLVRSRLAPAGYTGKKYAEDQKAAFPFSADDPRFNACLDNPSESK